MYQVYRLSNYLKDILQNSLTGSEFLHFLSRSTIMFSEIIRVYRWLRFHKTYLCRNNPTGTLSSVDLRQRV